MDDATLLSAEQELLVLFKQLVSSSGSTTGEASSTTGDDRAMGDSARQDLEQLRLASIGGVVARTPVYSQWQRALTEDKKLAQDYQNAKGGRSM